jgi:hypothetical protein
MHSEYKIVAFKGVPPADFEKALNEGAKEGWRITQVLQEPQWLLVERMTGDVQDSRF